MSEKSENSKKSEESKKSESLFPQKQMQILQGNQSNQFDPTALQFQSKIIHGHTQNTGIFFGRFCSGFAAYARHLAEIRDKGDEIARSFAQYSETQSHSPVTKKQLIEFSGFLAAVQDHMQARILRIEKKVVCGFSKYGPMCHILKSEVEKGVNIRDREQKFQDNLQKMQVKMRSDGDGDEHTRQQKVDFAAIAASDSQRAHALLLREADKFEQQKLEDVRQVLMHFCEIELDFHAKALKLYTQAYRSAKKLDIVDDIASFRTQMNIVRGSSSVDDPRTRGSYTDPKLKLKNCKIGFSPTESSTESELSSASLSDGGGSERDSPQISEKPTTSCSLPQERRKSAPTEKKSPILALKGEERPHTSSFTTEGINPQRYTRSAAAGACVEHFNEYREAVRWRRRSSTSKR